MSIFGVLGWEVKDRMCCTSHCIGNFGILTDLSRKLSYLSGNIKVAISPLAILSTFALQLRACIYILLRCSN